MKKICVCILAALLVLSILAACGQQVSNQSSAEPGTQTPSANAPSTQATNDQTTVPAAETVKFSATFLQNEWHGDPNDMEVLQKMAERANVEVDWEIYAGSAWGDKKALVLAGGDLPDVFYMGAINLQDVAKFAPQGMFIELTDLINQHAPNLVAAFERMPHYYSININPDDGNIYTIGRAAEREVQYTQSLNYINKKWLDQLGLDIPTTTDEYYSALKAFKDNNINGKGNVIPYSFHNNFNRLDFTYHDFFGAFGYVDFHGNYPHFIKDEKGDIIYVAMQPEYKEAIIFYGNMVREGLWDIEGFTTEDISVLNAKGSNPDEILGSFSAFDKTFIIPEERLDDYVILPPLTGPNGHKNYLYNGQSNGNVNGTHFAMTISARGKEEGIIRWLNEHFDERTSIELFLGPVGATLVEGPNGMLDYVPNPSGMNYSEFRFAHAPVHVPCAIPGNEWGKSIQVMAEDINKLQIAKEVYLPYSKQSSLFLIPSQEESSYMTTMGQDINDYANRMQVKWMTEGGIEAEWDTYLAELEKMGIQDYIARIKVMAGRMG